MAEIISFLHGGLGNQMFQYAAGRALSLNSGLGFALDTWSGFVRDRVFRRQYELGAFPIRARLLNPLERWPIWMYRLHSRTRGNHITPFEARFWYGRFLNEYHLLEQEFPRKTVDHTTWLNGFWQSASYFTDHAETIREELLPPTSSRRAALAVAQRMLHSDSVALGIRLYEESADPSRYARTGQLKTGQEIRQAVERVRSKHPKALFFVFCTHRAPLLTQLGLPPETVWVTGEDGYSDAIESLWLMTHCRHHIITNSTFYWWGAWLSGGRWKGLPQQVIAANNFANESTPCPNWELF